MDYAWHDAVGNFGVILIVVTFGLVQLRQMKATTLLYGVANAIGAGLILLSLVFQFNLSAFLMESFWLLASMLGIRLSLQERRAAP